MKIKMYEVNFGECILYQTENKKLLVDCGAKFGDKGKGAYERIKNELDFQTKLIITHFDEDHYNGILEIPSEYQFEEIILPLYACDDGEINYTMDMFYDTLYVWTYMIAMGYDTKINSMHRLFLKLPNLVKSVNDIKCVKKGDYISLGEEKIEILWPRDNSSVKYKTYRRIITNLMKEAETEGNKEELDAFKECADKYVSLFIKIYRFFDINKDSDRVTDILNNNLMELDKCYNRLLEKKMNIELNEFGFKRINNINQMKIKHMNECSIVFRIGEEIIAFGDVSERIIKYLSRNTEDYNMEYKVVKVQHHGTRAYWSCNLPGARKYLVSNSGNKRIGWSIYEKYGEEHRAEMICTNNNRNRCGYLKNGKQCIFCNLEKNEDYYEVNTNNI